MSDKQFLEDLRRELADVPPQEVDEIIADYRSYFDEARAAGRSIDEVVAAHGAPWRLARELRAEMGLRRWEEHRTPVNFWNAALALGGLVAVDVIILIPALLIVGLIVAILFFVFSLFGVIGIGTLLDVLSSNHDPAEGSATYLLLRSIGLLLACFVGATLLVFALRTAMAQLVRYARLHYRLLRPGTAGTALSSTRNPNSNV